MTQNVDRGTVVSRLLAADDILILCHKNPDGDTIGSGTALCLALSFFLGPAMGERITAAVSLACSLALCALGLKLSLELHSGWLFAFAAFGLLWGTLRQLGLARGAKSV